MNPTLPDNYKPTPNMLPDYPDLLSAYDLAKIFGVSKQTIYKEMNEGKFGNPEKIGRAYKVSKLYILERYFNTYQKNIPQGEAVHAIIQSG